MLVDNLAENSLRGSSQSLIGFYGLFFFFALPMHFVPKDALQQKENEQRDLRISTKQSRTVFFPLNVTKSKILVNVDVYFVFS